MSCELSSSNLAFSNLTILLTFLSSFNSLLIFLFSSFHSLFSVSSFFSLPLPLSCLACNFFFWFKIVDANISLICFIFVLKPLIISSFNLSNSETEITFLCF